MLSISSGPYAELNSLLYSYVANILLQDNGKSPKIKKSVFLGETFLRQIECKTNCLVKMHECICLSGLNLLKW